MATLECAAELLRGNAALVPARTWLLPPAGDAMETSGGQVAVLAVAAPAERESLVRLNEPDPLAGEQTWPTEEVRVAAF